MLVSFPDYAAPAVTAGGQKLGSTFRPSSDDGYTTPFTCAHYDTPGSVPEYAEPLPPEPEYATPFSELPPEHKPPTLTGLLHSTAQRPLAHVSTGHSRYDCPSHRVLFNGYCTPALHAGSPRPASEVYAEPKSTDSLIRKHTYEEPLWIQAAQLWRSAWTRGALRSYDANRNIPLRKNSCWSVAECSRTSGVTLNINKEDTRVEYWKTKDLRPTETNICVLVQFLFYKMHREAPSLIVVWEKQSANEMLNHKLHFLQKQTRPSF